MGGGKAVLQHKTAHPSPHNIAYGACYGHGTDVVWKAHIGPACASAPRRVSSAVARATAGKVLAGGCAHQGQSTRRGLTSPSMRGITSTIWLTSSWQRCRTRNRSRMNSHRTMHTHAAAAAEAAGLHTASIHSAICKKEPHHHLTKGPACLN